MDRTTRTGTGHHKPTATIDRADICRALADALAGNPHSDAAFQLDATGRLTISPHPRSILDIRPDADTGYQRLHEIHQEQTELIRDHLTGARSPAQQEALF